MLLYLSRLTIAFFCISFSKAFLLLIITILLISFLFITALIVFILTIVFINTFTFTFFLMTFTNRLFGIVKLFTEGFITFNMDKFIIKIIIIKIKLVNSYYINF